VAWIQADLTAVEQAIRDIITKGAAKSYIAEDGRSLTRMDLPWLRDLRREIAAEVSETNAAFGCPTRTYVDFEEVS
jgi:hypothetical protein